MTQTLSFTGSMSAIKLPAIQSGFTSGMKLQLWVRRTGTGSRQRIIELGNGLGTRAVLETGDQADSLTLGVENSSGRTEIMALGVLPVGRWVQVTATIPPSGSASLAIFGATVASGPIGLPVGGDPVNVHVAGGSHGNPFVGQLSQLGVWLLGSSGGPWGVYPLDQAILDHTDQSVTPPVSYYKIDDTSTHNHDGTVTGTPVVEPYASPLNGPPVQVFELDGTGAPLRISPIVPSSQGLSLEAWIRPTQAAATQAVMMLATSKGQLVLCAGGSQQELSLQLITSRGAYTLLSVPQAVVPGIWSHVAATLHQDSISAPLVFSLYQQGQLIESGSLQSPASLRASNMFIALTNPSLYDRSSSLESILQAKIIPSCYIGGQTSTIGMFSGRMSEVRIWAATLSPLDVASRFLARAVGNEPGLVACYRLEHIADGCTYDISACRGFGKVPAGCSLYSAVALPLYPTESASSVTLNVRGKLVTETVIYPARTVQIPFGFMTQTITIPVQSVPVTVFDATIEPVTPDGTALTGQSLQICPDDNVTVILDDDVYVRNVSWSAGQIYSIQLPQSGQIRLRFQAGDLACPTLRMRTDGMLDGIWTLVRPDTPALKKLLSITAQDLETPANGAASPLPGGATSDDAAMYTQTLILLANAMVPPLPPPTTTDPRARGFFGDVSSTLSGVGNTIVSGIDSGVSTVGSALRTAGSAAGSLCNALVDDGTAALSSATVAVKSATQLVVSDASALSDLLNATVQAAARFGQSEIATCIASADSLALVSMTELGDVVHTFAVVGTSLVNGATVAWRVVCAGVRDAIAAASAWLKRVGADIKKFLDYLAYLFKWHDFVIASDDIYKYFDQCIASIPNLFSGLSAIKSQISTALSSAIPADIGQKSIAQILGIPVNPKNPVVEELNYLIEQVQKIMSSSQSVLDGMQQAALSAAGGTNPIDLSSVQGAVTSTLALVPMDNINPVSLLTLPLQSLFGGASSGSAASSIVDSLFQSISGDFSSALSLAQQALTARLYVPELTALIEKTILEGRTLNLQRIISLCGAIPMVLFQKISASAASDQPQAFDIILPPAGPNTPWLFMGAGIVQSLLEAWQSLIVSRGGTTSTLVFLIDYACAMIFFAKAVMNHGMAQKWSGPAAAYTQKSADIETATGAWLLFCTTFLKQGGAAAAFFADAGFVALFVAEVVTAICGATAGAFDAQVDWASFALQDAVWATDAFIEAWRFFVRAKGQSPALMRVTMGLNGFRMLLSVGTAIAEGLDSNAQNQGS